MLNLPPDILPLLLPFASIFVSKKTFFKALILMMGGLLCRSGVTVCSALRAVGLSAEQNFCRYHRLLNRDRWNLFAGAKILLLLLLRCFPSEMAMTFAIDDTLERRKGKHINAKGWFKDPIQSNNGKVVTSSGLRWMPVMLLTHVPFIGRIFALSFLTILVPSEKKQKELGKRHRSPQHRASQVVCLLRRWFRNSELRLVVDAGYACIGLARQCIRHHVTLITRLRVNARLFELPPPRTGKKGRPRQKGNRLNLREKAKTLCWNKYTIKGYKGVEEVREIAEFTCLWAPAGKGSPIHVRVILSRDPFNIDGSLFALLTTDMKILAKEVVEVYILRWNQEVTHREVREHLGMETQRQWSDLAIERSTPLIFALHSLVFVIASHLYNGRPFQAAQCAWYSKERLTFSDLLHAVRGVLREHIFSRVLAEDPILQKFPPSKELVEALLRLAEAA
jgi:hypothetical protein